MKEVEIPKRSGGVRLICVPSPRHKAQLRKAIPKLQALVRQCCDLNVVHGFAELRSPVTNAARHVGYRFTLSFDLADFFDTVKKEMFAQAHPLQQPDCRRCWHKGVARQGLPTSPIIANLAAAALDKEIQQNRIPATLAYTRYADDLCISFNDPEIIERITNHVRNVIKHNGFALNERKTTLQDADRGRRHITGIAVDDEGLHPTRKAKRKLRAAVHNAKTGKVKHFPRRQWTQYRKACRYRGERPLPKRVWLKRWLWKRVCGLREWNALKVPNVGRRSAERIAAAYDATEALKQLAQRTMP